MADIGARAGLTGRRAAVVGGAAGLGEAVTRALAESGVAVTFCDLDAAAVDATTAALTAAGHDVRGEVADAEDAEALAAFYRGLDADAGLDVVVNVVGGTFHGYFTDSDPASRARDVERNYGYVLRSCHLALPLLRAGRAGGSIVNFTTIEAFRGAAGYAVYAGAKAAVTNFTRALAVELGPERIRANCVAPDTTPTSGNMHASPVALREHGLDEARAAALFTEGMRMYVPTGESPAADEVANAVLFLASDLSTAVTGTTVHVDGGTWAASGFVNWPFGDWLPVPNATVLDRIFPAAGEHERQARA